MGWVLFEAQLVCARRRMGAAFAAAPVVVGAAVLALALSPVAALWVGTRVADDLRRVAADAALAHAAALASCLAAALAGVAVALAVDARAALGSICSVAPVERRSIVVGTTILPLAAVLTALAAPAIAFLLPVTRVGTPWAVAALAASFALGGAAAEAALALARRALRGALWAGAVVALAAVDPSRALADALAGAGTPTAVAVAPVAFVLWVVATTTRPNAVSRAREVRFAGRGIFATALLRYARTQELRRQAAASVAIAAAGAALLRALGSANDVSFLFAATTGCFGAALVPLAAPGLDSGAEWLWRSAPRSRTRVGGVFALAALAAGAAVATVAVAASLAAAPAAPARLAPIAALGSVLLGAALLAGAAVPWRRQGAIEQLATYGAFALAVAGLSIALARSASVLGAQSGLRAAALAAVAVAACAASAVVLGARE